MLRIFQNENPAPKHQRSLKMVLSMMVISFTLSLLVTFTELSEIYALPSREEEEEAVVFQVLALIQLHIQVVLLPCPVHILMVLAPYQI